MKKSFLLIIGCTVIFTGCTVRGPSVDLPSVEVPGVSIGSPVNVSRDRDGYRSNTSKKGCPPGLAKQGRC